MSRFLAYLPIGLGVLLIVALTVIQVRMTDRLSPLNITAAERAKLLEKIPDKIGDWQGTDMEVDEQVRQTAGAVGAVSRKYRNVRTGEEVDLWLIVGHGRSVARHTPDVCYRSSGFTARSAENSPYPMSLEDGAEVPFFTNTFFREDVSGRRLIRVFWTWYNSQADKNQGKVVWEAPSNPTWYFGNTRALYKMYFTSVMRGPMETAEKSPCLNFAREFLPIVDKALSQESNGDAAPGPNAEDATATAEPEPKAEAKVVEESPVEAATEQPVETPMPNNKAEEAPSAK